MSSLLSHKLCLILPSTSLLLLFVFVSLPSTFATRSCASNFALGTLALFLSLSLAPLSVDCDCGSHFNALLFVFAAAAVAATAGSSASFSFYFPVSAAQIPSPVCTRFVIAFNKNSCCSLLVSPTPSTPLFYTASHSYTFITALLRCRRRALSLSSSAALDKCPSLSDGDATATATLQKFKALGARARCGLHIFILFIIFFFFFFFFYKAQLRRSCGKGVRAEAAH